MGETERALRGAAGGAAGTVVLSVLRSVLRSVGVVYKTAPMQVVERLEQADFVPDQPAAKLAVSLAAHFVYGTAAGAAFGALRRKREGAGTEVAVGTALGALLWGFGWAGWRAQRYNWRFQRIGTASPAASRRPCLPPP